jgi:hypothetical protein
MGVMRREREGDARWYKLLVLVILVSPEHSASEILVISML